MVEQPGTVASQRKRLVPSDDVFSCLFERCDERRCREVSEAAGRSTADTQFTPNSSSNKSSQTCFYFDETLLM